MPAVPPIFAGSDHRCYGIEVLCRSRIVALLLGVHSLALPDALAAPAAPTPPSTRSVPVVAPAPSARSVRAATATHKPKKSKPHAKATRVGARAQRQHASTKGPRQAPPRHRRNWHHSTASFPADFEHTPAYRYAQLEPSACYAELRQRDLPVAIETERRPGLSAPVRLTGPLNGVTFRTDIAPEQRASTPYELFDCRLVLALHDFTAILREEGIQEVVMSSAYRPPPKSFTVDDQGKRHGGGLAIDMHRFGHQDGRWIKVDRDFHGRLGADVCGTKAVPPIPASEEARLLRRLVCSAAQRRLFQSILTPNYDRPHHNHLHLEITLGVRWFIVS